MGKSKEIEDLEELCLPIVDYLKENYNPHYEVVISERSIKLMSSEIGIPINDKND